MDISYGNWNIYNKEGYLTSWYETSLTRLHTLIGIGNAWCVTDPIWRQGVNTFAAHVWDPSRHIALWYECNIDSYIYETEIKIRKFWKITYIKAYYFITNFVWHLLHFTISQLNLKRNQKKKKYIMYKNKKSTNQDTKI